MAASAIFDFWVSLHIEKKGPQTPAALRLLFVSLSLNLGLLFFFKYLNFSIENAWWVLGLFADVGESPVLDIILSLSISFYTFQTISYFIDVYRGVIRAEKDFPLYLSYVTFFPQLVAGPILRVSEVAA